MRFMIMKCVANQHPTQPAQRISCSDCLQNDVQCQFVSAQESCTRCIKEHVYCYIGNDPIKKRKAARQCLPNTPFQSVKRGGSCFNDGQTSRKEI